jgi:hypothetical protein
MTAVARLGVVRADDHLFGALDRGERGRADRLRDGHPRRRELARAPEERTVERIAGELLRADHDEERRLAVERVLEPRSAFPRDDVSTGNRSRRARCAKRAERKNQRERRGGSSAGGHRMWFRT